MADGPFQRLRRFLSELRRRNVYQVAATYAVVGFVVIQAANLIFPALNIPSWAYSLVVVLTLLGFPLALVVAWAFEVTPEGVRRTPEAEPTEDAAAEAAPGLSTGYKVLVGLGLVAAAVAGGWYLTGGGGPTINDRSVAVLPFETLGDTASSTFTEGLHNDLVTRLQRVSDLTVIARPSVMRYESTDKPLSQVANELNARWIVTAAVQSSGDQVQVNPRLINPRSGTERWSNSYQRELSADQVFAVQGEITRQIAEALKAQLAEAEKKRVNQRPTGDLNAYRLYVQGRQQLAQRTFSPVPNEHVEQAVRYFRRAIEQDSSFALAWTGLADAAALYPSEVPDSVVAPDVGQEYAARRALSLDSDLAEAHASLGFFHFQKQNGPAALRQLKRAIELKPSYWEAHNWLGHLYWMLGRPKQALNHLTLAVNLNPQHALARHYLYDTYLSVGQAKKSLKVARRQQRMGLEPRGAFGGEIRALYHLNRFEEARRLAEKQEHLSYLVVIRAAQGDTAEARKLLRQLKSSDRWLKSLHLGLGHAALGETEEAFEAWQRMAADYWGEVPTVGFLRYGILLDLSQLRDDPRYQELMREANRAWGLNPDGSLPDSVNVSFGSNR